MCNGAHKQEHHQFRNPNTKPKHNLALNNSPSLAVSSSPINVDLNNSITVDNDGSINTDSGSVCELCGSEATVYCRADDAYLCGRCDGWVHGANFLANRHVRCVLCDTCHRFSQRYLVGAGREVVVGRKRRRPTHCDGRDDCSSPRMLKRPFLFL